MIRRIGLVMASQSTIFPSSTCEVFLALLSETILELATEVDRLIYFDKRDFLSYRGKPPHDHLFGPYSMIMMRGLLSAAVNDGGRRTAGLISSDP
jgi:hypothetical protein